MQRREVETYLVQVLPKAKMMTGQCYSSLFLLFVYSSGSCFLYFPGSWSYEWVLPSLSSVSLCLWFSLFVRPLSFYTLSVCSFSPVLLTLSTLSPSVCLSPVSSLCFFFFVSVRAPPASPARLSSLFLLWSSPGMLRFWCSCCWRWSSGAAVWKSCWGWCSCGVKAKTMMMVMEGCPIAAASSSVSLFLFLFVCVFGLLSFFLCFSVSLRFFRPCFFRSLPFVPFFFFLGLSLAFIKPEKVWCPCPQKWWASWRREIMAASWV